MIIQAAYIVSIEEGDIRKEVGLYITRKAKLNLLSGHLVNPFQPVAN